MRVGFAVAAAGPSIGALHNYLTEVARIPNFVSFACFKTDTKFGEPVPYTGQLDNLFHMLTVGLGFPHDSELDGG